MIHLIFTTINVAPQPLCETVRKFAGRFHS